MSIFDNPSTGRSWLDAPLKAEGTSVTDSYTYNTAKGRSYTAMSPLIVQEGDRTIVVSEMLMRLEYVLQRTVPNYDELVEQYNAIKDIERSNNDIR
jgi:hypothetical protein